MAHTVTRPQAQRRLHAEPLTAWRGWLVYGHCASGHAPGPQTVEALLAFPDGPKTIGHLLHRLRCPQCGAPPEGLALRRNVQSQTWVTVQLPAHLEMRRDEQTDLPGTVRVEWWRR
ncbi:hypothetical protein QMO56_25825 [Roseomonas sp. E05]|uniref:hypothetical protein n=1 Tax=Roseomonas sp. E05 TaxID=3046310 RepID=UPI0024BA7697|nr:hypothetical protein [Roseomonas sp. E05]MDJ0391526.1 hypothetical protein [Roseomonas sp. E05]